MLAGGGLRHCMSVFLFYADVSLFIINGLYVNMVVCVVYAYNLTWGGLKNGKNGGEPNGFCLIFVSLQRVAMGVFGKAPLSLNLFREIFFEFHHVYSQSMSDRLSAHVRPVVHVIILHVFQLCVQYI